MSFQYAEGRTFPTENPPYDIQEAPGILESDYYMLERGLELFPHRDDFRWIVSEKQEGVRPAQKSHYLPYGGFIAMRNSWDRDANFLGMKGSNSGLMHATYDRNMVVLWAYGRPLLWNTPQSGEETRTKSLVIVDGKGQVHTGGDGTAEKIDMAWQSTETYDHASSMYESFWGSAPNRPCRHIRRVVFIKPDIFLVIDDMVALDSRANEYEARWVVRSQQLEKNEKTIISTDDNQPNLIIAPLNHRGMQVAKYLRRDHPDFQGITGNSYKNTSVVTQSRSGKGNQRFVNLLLPLKRNDSTRIESITEIRANQWTVILNDGRQWKLTLDNSHQGTIRFTETGGDSRQVAITSGSIERPYHLFHENFEIYDQLASDNVFSNIGHLASPPGSLKGAQGRWTGKMTVPSSGKKVAKSTIKQSIPSGTEVLDVHAKVGYPDPLPGEVRFRFSLLAKDKYDNGQQVYSSWMPLDDERSGTFIDYSSSVSLPGNTVRIREISMEVEQTGTGPKESIYLDSVCLFIGTPEVSLLSPSGEHALHTTSTIDFRAIAFDNDGSVHSVEFFVNDTSIGVDSAGHDGWSIKKTGFAEGELEVKAMVTDNRGRQNDSDPLRVRILPPPPPEETGYWKFEGNALNEITSHTGRPYSGLVFEQGLSGRSAFFDGNAGMMTDDMVLSSDSGSISFWFNPSQGNEQGIIFHASGPSDGPADNRMLIRLDGDKESQEQVLQYSITGNPHCYGQTPGTLDNVFWHHAVFTWNQKKKPRCTWITNW